jgi:hypothetical protein
MSTNALNRPMPIGTVMLGRFLESIVIFFLLFDGASKFVSWPFVTSTMDRIGYGSTEAVERAIGMIGLACTALTIPPTSMLGAILWTGYLGEAVINYLRLI